MPKSKPILIGGLYLPPQPSDILHDEVYGDVEVGGWSTGPIPWPRRKKAGRHSLILCGDLIRAVRTESVAAIAWWFGVSETTVWKWRVTLGVDINNNAGTQRLYKLLITEKLTPEVSARGREAARSPEAIDRQRRAKRGRPSHPNTKAALATAASQPKPEGWGKRANAWMLNGKRHRAPQK